MARKSSPDPLEQRRTDYEDRVLRLVAVRYDAATGELDLTLSSGIRVSIPRQEIWELASASEDQLKQLYVGNGGATITQDRLDVDIFVPGLLDDFFGRTIRAERGRRSGRVSTPAKAAAARKNGKRGGRPRTTSVA